jgi:DtxR family Mn-dependent transcriptional regulator
VRLTRNGEQLALHVLRRHRLVELFLVKVLRLDWSEVHHEAETLEHAVSDKVLAAIDEALGHPRVDPHGDPIPSAKGKVAAVSATTLVDCEVDRRVRVIRVLDQTPAFLQFVERCGLRPGASVRVIDRSDVADMVVVTPEGKRPVTLGWSAAGKIGVE